MGRRLGGTNSIKTIWCRECGEPYPGMRIDGSCPPCSVLRRKEINDTDYERHREKRLSYIQEYRRRNPGKQSAWNNKWRERNPEKSRAIRSKAQRKRHKAIQGDYTFEEWKALKLKYKNRCPGCRRYEPEIKLTVDHIMPIARGGTNNIENIQPLCLSCNSKKQTRLISYPFFE